MQIKSEKIELVSVDFRAVVFIPLRGKSNKVTVVDFNDYQKYKLFDLKISENNGYARVSCGKNEYLHRMITDFKFEIVDHIDRDKMNNRKDNLRRSTYAKNLSNSLSPLGYKFKGAIKTKFGKFRSTIVINGKSINLGSYDSEIPAAIAYNAAAIVTYGKHALLNEVRNGN